MCRMIDFKAILAEQAKKESDERLRKLLKLQGIFIMTPRLKKDLKRLKNG